MYPANRPGINFPIAYDDADGNRVMLPNIMKLLGATIKSQITYAEVRDAQNKIQCYVPETNALDLDLFPMPPSDNVQYYEIEAPRGFIPNLCKSPSAIRR